MRDPDSIPKAKLQDENDALRAENDKLRRTVNDRTAAVGHYMSERAVIQRELDALQVKYTDLAFEVERMRPVADAAIKWRDNSLPFNGGHEMLVLAVDEFRAAQQETP